MGIAVRVEIKIACCWREVCSTPVSSPFFADFSMEGAVLEKFCSKEKVGGSGVLIGNCFGPENLRCNRSCNGASLGLNFREAIGALPRFFYWGRGDKIVEKRKCFIFLKIFPLRFIRREDEIKRRRFENFLLQRLELLDEKIDLFSLL